MAIVTKKGYIRKFVKLFMKKTGLNYEYAKDNAKYVAEDIFLFEEFDDSTRVQQDVDDAIHAHF